MLLDLEQPQPDAVFSFIDLTPATKNTGPIEATAAAGRAPARPTNPAMKIAGLGKKTMHHLVLTTAVLLATIPATALPQSAPAAPGVIAGRLTSADLGRPVRKAEVTLTSTAPRMTRRTISDANGRFAFTGVLAGEYSLAASKPGYLPIVYGAARPGGSMPGAFIRLTAGQTIDTLEVRVPRGGVIAGVVTDEFGDPAFNVPVRALRYGYSEAGRTITGGGNAVTDDLGAYRIAGLLPGEYVVSAVPRDSVASAEATAESLRQAQARMLAAARERGTERAMQASFDTARREGRDPAAPVDPTGYVAMYHPSSPKPAGAARVRLGAGEQMSAVDIQLHVLETGAVTGRILGTQGSPVAARLQLIDPSMPVANLAVWFRTAASDGRFSFRGIPPGSYVVRAQASAGEGAGERTASADVQVDEGGVHDVALTLRGGVSASGALDLNTLAGVDIRKLQVDLMVIAGPSDWEAPLGTAVPDAEGRFVIRGLAPGRYRVGVRGLPEGWALASATFDDRDAADYHLQVETRSVTGGLLKFTSRLAQVAGTVTNASGDPVTDRVVVLFPEENDLWVPRSRRVRLAQPGADGRFVIRELPPGNYRMAAVIPPEPGQEFDPEFLSQAAAGSMAVTVVGSAQATLNLRVR